MDLETPRLTAASHYISVQRPVSSLARLSPSAVFYVQILNIIYQAARLCRRGAYTGDHWVQSSIDTISALENVGGRFVIQNLDVLRQLDGPCVFISNHMSILETFVLPSLIQPILDVTFVVKESLMSYPYFKHVLGSRNPIVVGRLNPRTDFKTVMEEGRQRLMNRISVIVFPQTTRSVQFDPTQFNTLGVKLAKRCKVPIVPVAIKTDAWGIGRIIKDCGKIRPEKTVRIYFHAPLVVSGTGRQTQAQIVEFIDQTLRTWSRRSA